MRYDFITNEILQNHKFFEIQFDGEQQVYIHGDHSISIPTLGTQYGTFIGKEALFIDSNASPIDISSFGDHITLIFKYRILNFNDTDTLFLGDFFGCYPNLYVGSRNKTYAGRSTLTVDGMGAIWTLTKKGFGNKTYTNYELAFEIKPGQFKVWLNGKLMSKFEWEGLKATSPYIRFYKGRYSPKFYLNDVFCINKSEFLPDQYTVNWREPWYDLIYKPIYFHNENFYSK